MSTNKLTFLYFLWNFCGFLVGSEYNPKHQQKEQTNMPPTPHIVEVKLAAKNPEKVHSRVFESATPDAVIKSVYLSRPQSNNHSKARITVEFLD